MKIRRNGSRFVVVRDDGTHAQFSYALILVFVAPIVIAAVALIWFSRPHASGRLSHEVGTAAENLLHAAPAPVESRLRTLRIATPKNRLVELDRTLRRNGGRPFRNAAFADDDSATACEIAWIAPRGHHDSNKPSLRVKFRKVDARDGVRRLDLYRPEEPLAVDAILYSWFADTLDVIDDSPQIVRLFVNRKPFGVYHLTRPPGRGLSIDAGRADGIFVFSEPGTTPWSRLEAWHQFGRADLGGVPLRALFDALDAGSTERLHAILDVESFARWHAIRAVLGRVGYPGAQTCLFFTPRNGRFEIVAWPFDGTRGAADAPIDADDRLTRMLRADANWVRARDRAIIELLDGVARVESQRALLTKLHSDAAADLEADLHLVERETSSGRLLPVAVTSLPARRAELDAWIEQRAAFLRDSTGPTTALSAPPPLELGPGVVTLEQDLITAVGQELIIRAGTRLQLAAGTAIHARGPVRALGSAAAPIVVAATTFQPWSVFTIGGSASGESELSYVQFDDGSTGHHHEQQLDAYLTIHDCPDVELRNCRFAPSAVDADSVHVYRSQARLIDCVFEDARRDALDLAYSYGTLRDCKFIAAERNGIDMSASNFTIEHCLVGAALRAAISVGERSRAHILRCDVRSSDLGIECRDDARAFVESTGLRDCRIAVTASRVDWRATRGGAIGLRNCRCENSREADVTIYKRAEVRLRDCPKLKIGNGRSRLHHDDALDAEWLASANS